MSSFLSIVVISYNIPRELPRTLQSLSPAFQQDIGADEYEVVVVDNGSTQPPDVSEARGRGLDVRVIANPSPSSSPCRAINLGLNSSMGRNVGVFIDGARLASPRLLATAREALTLSDRAVVGCRGRYLGPKVQRESVLEGYSREVEDRMLADIDWTRNGYRLFEVSVPDESAGESILSTPSESNALFMSRRLWAELGGYGEEFIEPGGGYANLDMWTRATTFPGALPILLLGESTFHQLHGGVATNAVVPRQVEMHAEYERIRGTSHEVPTLDLHYWGSVANRAFRERGSGERVDLDDPALWSAFRERDRAIAELEAVVDSTIWRSTAWYRRLRNGRAPGTSPS